MYNLESVIKFSSANNSQSFPVSYYEKNPTESYTIMNQGAKGDFLAALHRGSGAEIYLSETFRQTCKRCLTRVNSHGKLLSCGFQTSSNIPY